MMNEHPATSAANQIYEQTVRGNNNAQEQKEIHAGFWKRFLATCIDGIIYFIIFFIIVRVISLIGNLTGYMDTSYSYAESYSPPSTGQVIFVIASSLITFFMRMIFPWLYFSLFEKSKYQATIGKMAVGIVVVDQQYRPLRFGKATGRYWSKWLSGLTLCIGYMMAGWTGRKQGLHDIIASTYVVNKRALPQLQQQKLKYEQQLKEFNAHQAVKHTLL
ncbi:RDD family protein [Paenibacillus dauci]|uniref:RDD family protein n=1 Tax=Paenibacillus dauci TaxID=1567106 RepID=UPI000698F11B|nr:RDD family protein [Paenibacillus dauci]